MTKRALKALRKSIAIYEKCQQILLKNVGNKDAWYAETALMIKGKIIFEHRGANCP
jgi:hypothetical protein